MKCKCCNSVIADDSTFCEHCGKKVEQQENVLLSIMEGASLDEDPLVAYKARNKCCQLCRTNHPYDYKEYVKKIMADSYPILFERCKIDLKYIKRCVIFSLLFCFCFCIAYSVHWEASDTFLYTVGDYSKDTEWQIPYDSQGPLDTIYVDYIILGNGARYNAYRGDYGLPYNYFAIFIICCIICIISLVLLLFKKKWYKNQKQKSLSI